MAKQQEKKEGQKNDELLNSGFEGEENNTDQKPKEAIPTDFTDTDEKHRGRVIIFKEVGENDFGVYIGRGREIAEDSKFGAKGTFAFAKKGNGDNLPNEKILIPASTVFTRKMESVFEKHGEKELIGKALFDITYLGKKEGDQGEYYDYKIAYRGEKEPMEFAYASEFINL